MPTGFLYDARYLKHQTGAGHPECPERLAVTFDYLKVQPWFKDLKRFSARLADEKWIRSVHSKEYILRVKQACERGKRYLDTPDVGISADSFECARLAAGGALELADQMMSGNTTNGFALLRPPGHHAGENSAMGFCLFNNIAILARYLQKKYGLEKILILDWDVHHGNGTQHTFEEDPGVFYVSLHQYPFYPGTGAASETGVGRGRGATLNCPMAAGSGDSDYQKSFSEIILPRTDFFKPDVVLISAGFDAHEKDPLGGIRLTTECFAWMSRRMIEVANKFSKNRLLSLLEGGYNLDVLPACIAAHLQVLKSVKV